MVVFSGFYESHEPPPSGDTRGIAPPHRDVHRNGQQSGYMFIMIVAMAAAGAIRSEVARWRHSVASGEALDMLHQVMRSVSHQHTAMAIEMARNGGTFVRRRRLFRLL